MVAGGGECEAELAQPTLRGPSPAPPRVPPSVLSPASWPEGSVVARVCGWRGSAASGDDPTRAVAVMGHNSAACCGFGSGEALDRSGEAAAVTRGDVMGEERERLVARPTLESAAAAVVV